MNNTKYKAGLLPVMVLAACISTSALADEHDHRQHEAHEHGVGLLNIALEHDALHIELESPAMNIVGFEHKPASQKQQTAVEEAITTLRKGDRLFALNAEAGCKLLEADVDTALLDEHAEHADKHREHASGKEHDEEAHADFDASYVFKCRHAATLNTIDVKLFQLFPGTEELEVQLLTDKGQTALHLTPSNSQLQF